MRLFVKSLYTFDENLYDDIYIEKVLLEEFISNHLVKQFETTFWLVSSDNQPQLTFGNQKTFKNVELESEIKREPFLPGCGGLKPTNNFLLSFGVSECE